MRSMHHYMDSVGRVTIPKQVRERYGITKDTQLNLTVKDTKTLLITVSNQPSVFQVYPDYLGRLVIPVNLRSYLGLGEDSHLTFVPVDSKTIEMKVVI